MSDITKYQGVIPAFYACYDEKGEVSGKAVRELTEYFIKKGVKSTTKTAFLCHNLTS